jgi:hypothetical protein
MTFPEDVHVDWNYFLDNESTLMADEIVKDKLRLGEIMK